MADTKDEIDMKDDEIDLKDELEPLLGTSSISMKTDFKDEFSEELDTDPPEDQDTESDEVNDAEEVSLNEQSALDESELVPGSELIMTDEGNVGDNEDEPENDPLNEDAIEDPIAGDEEGINGVEQDEEVALGDVDEDMDTEDVVDSEQGLADDLEDQVNLGDDDTEAALGEDETDAALDEGEDTTAEANTNSDATKPQTGTKRKAVEPDKPEVTLRKSSRIKQLIDLRKEKEETMLQGKSVHDTQKEKTKMLQKPTERPTRLDDDNSESEKVSDTEKDEEPVEESTQGDRTRPPGADAERKIDQDFLMPFRFGWTREVVIRPVKTGPPQIDIFYWPPKDGEDHGTRNREARRKRRSKVDQERYFEEFAHPQLSVNNFSYVRRALGLNNEAYEIVRSSKPSLETRSDKRTRAGKVASYKEVAEHEGLLSSNSSEDEEEEVEDITEFDQGLPLSLQVMRRVTPLREESKKRRKFPDRDNCVTPPLAEDIGWTFLDDDPLGIYTELGGRSSPATPPPLRAVRLTSHLTVQTISEKYDNIRSELADPLTRITSGNKDLDLKDNLASHDSSIRKYKNFKPAIPFQQRAVQGRVMQKIVPGRGPPGSVRHPQARAQPRLITSNTSSAGHVKVRLPMLSTNGKRPVVELVMLTNGKYQPIKFTNNRQVTESIPKRLFEQANGMRKTLYQRSVQVPKIGTKQVFIAINPSPGGFKPFNGSPAAPAPTKPAQVSTDQVSILVRPAQGGNAVLLNVPRHVAQKVKIGTTLSFSASSEQKYTVIDNKMHPPVGKNRPAPVGNRPPQPRPAARSLPSLPAGVSIRPINRTGATRAPVSRQSPQLRPGLGRTQPVRPPYPRQIQGQIRQPNKPRGVSPSLVRKSAPNVSNFTPCSPFCPGVTGIPELECASCHSLFHPKCVGIPASRIAQIQGTFRCKACGSQSAKGSAIQVIDLD